MISATRYNSRIPAVMITCMLLTIFLACDAFGKSKKPVDTLTMVPFGGNAWRTDKDTTGGNISKEGIANWSSANAVFTSYIRFVRTGKLAVYLHMSVPKGKSSISVTALGTSKTITTSGNGFRDVYVGDWMIRDTGYVTFRLKGISKTGDIFANVAEITVSGAAAKAKMNFVKDNEGEFFYWGRRGPSVHLGYQLPDSVKAEWFYNEVTVPKGNDILGSYFMACGFNEGYFGMQVNSPTERHILFSVWSPFNTDDPKTIPEDQKIIMLKKGEKVHTGEFGNEGSGGQSYLDYMWKPGNTYKFLVHAQPDGNGRTEYTAYFYAPEMSKWQLIASFSRPKTNTYLKHLHSFLENFEPKQGTKAREVHFNNEWICDSNGKWIELTKARFTIDNTGAKGYRMDYAGGSSGNSFYLKNCGFFNGYTPRNIFVERPLGGKKPDVDLNTIK